MRRPGDRARLPLGLFVPLLRDGEAIGAIASCAQTPGRSTTRRSRCSQTFADQAVIAIENVRLFNETKEALERQTATAEVLRVISASPTDVQPVFDAIAERAGACSCGAEGSRRLAAIGRQAALRAMTGDGPTHGRDALGRC